MRALIVGAGIAGLTLALRLHRLGGEPIVIERAPRLRGEGYMLDFFGPGFDAAQRLELLAQLERIHHQIPELLFVDAEGEPELSLAYPKLRRRLFAGRHFNFLRGDLEQVLYDQLRERVEVRFDRTVRALSEDEGGVEVELSDGSRERGDVLVGADGVHSAVRALAFGPESRFALDLGHVTAAWTLARPPSGVSPRAFTTLSAPGRMVAVYPIPDGRAATFFVHRSVSPAADIDRDPGELLDGVYGDLGWIVPQLLATMPTAGEAYVDDVRQIRLEPFTRGRIALLGDAAWCVTLLAGQGASLALAGGERLGSALGSATGDPRPVLAAWADRMQAPVAARQKSGARMARWFVPEDPVRSWLRLQLLRTSTWPLLSGVMRRGLAVGRAAS